MDVHHNRHLATLKHGFWRSQPPDCCDKALPGGCICLRYCTLLPPAALHVWLGMRGSLVRKIEGCSFTHPTVRKHCTQPTAQHATSYHAGVSHRWQGRRRRCCAPHRGQATGELSLHLLHHHHLHHHHHLLLLLTLLSHHSGLLCPGCHRVALCLTRCPACRSSSLRSSYRPTSNLAVSSISMSRATNKPNLSPTRSFPRCSAR